MPFTFCDPFDKIKKAHNSQKWTNCNSICYIKWFRIFKLKLIYSSLTFHLPLDNYSSNVDQDGNFPKILWGASSGNQLYHSQGNATSYAKDQSFVTIAVNSYAAWQKWPPQNFFQINLHKAISILKWLKCYSGLWNQCRSLPAPALQIATVAQGGKTSSLKWQKYVDYI